MPRASRRHREFYWKKHHHNIPRKKNAISQCDFRMFFFSFFLLFSSLPDEKNPLSQTMPDKPTELRHFGKLCEQRRKFPILYKLEFQTAVKVETNTCRHATRKANAHKNQNPKCIPYDYNRVVLGKYENIPDTDYINASYVDVSTLLVCREKSGRNSGSWGGSPKFDIANS